MEGTTRPRQRAPQVLRTFAPTRLQADLLATVYDRLLDVGTPTGDVRDGQKEHPPGCVSAEHGHQAETGGRHA